jgi:hypothetical protein
MYEATIEFEPYHTLIHCIKDAYQELAKRAQLADRDTGCILARKHWKAHA